METNVRTIRIATVCKGVPLAPRDVQAMDTVRWMRISHALAEAGFQVDVIVAAHSSLESAHPNLRYVARDDADWSTYHVVKTLYQGGFRELVEAGGAGHPFIISRLASVVGSADGLPGVHFVGDERAALFEVQEKIQRTSRYVALSSEPNRELWRQEFGDGTPLLMVPTGVDRSIPPPRQDPYRSLGGSREIVVYIGHLYQLMQRQVNLLWQERLNRLGTLLRARGLQLVFIGPGLTDRLDPGAVVNLGPVPHCRIWDYQYFARVGLVLAQGPVQANESSKIYYYLRTGLPVVSEASVPNNDLITAAGCGLIAPYGQDRALAEMIEAAAHHAWDRRAAISYVLAHHTWDQRIAVYRDVIVRHFGIQAVAPPAG